MPALAHGAKSQGPAQGIQRMRVAPRGPAPVLGPGPGVIARLPRPCRVAHLQIGLIRGIAVGQVVHATLRVIQVQAQAGRLLPAVVKRWPPVRKAGVDAHAKSRVGDVWAAQVDVPEPGKARLDGLGPRCVLGVHRHLGACLHALVLRVRLGLGRGPRPIGGLFPDLDGVAHESLLGCRSDAACCGC